MVRSIETPSSPSQQVDQGNANRTRDAYLSPIVVTPLVQAPFKQVNIHKEIKERYKQVKLLTFGYLSCLYFSTCCLLFLNIKQIS